MLWNVWWGSETPFFLVKCVESLHGTFYLIAFHHVDFRGFVKDACAVVFFGSDRYPSVFKVADDEDYIGSHPEEWLIILGR